MYASSVDKSPVFLIPELGSPPPGTIIEMQGVPDLTYHIEVSDISREIGVSGARPEERDLVSRMVERAFTDRFVALKSQYWQSEWTAFFRASPENASSPQENINAFRGIKFGVVFLADGSPFLAADARTHYIGRRALCDCTPGELTGGLAGHVDLELPLRRRANFARDNGSRKITCKYAGETGKTIRDFRISETGQSVYDYYRSRYPNIPVRPDDKAVFAQDGEEGPTRPVPASRLFPIFGTGYEGVQSCSVRSQLTPQERVAFLRDVLNGMGPVTYEASKLMISPEFHSVPRTVFPPPVLEFGGGQYVRIDDVEGGRPGDDFDSRVTRWSHRKMPSLYRNAAYHFEPIPDVVLFFPDTLPRPVREGLLSSLAEEIQRQTRGTFRVISQQSYTTGRGERGGRSLLSELRRCNAENPRHLALIVLWSGLDDRVHGDLKELLGPQPSQCVTDVVAEDILSRGSNRSITRLRNLALAVLTETGSKPWVLAGPLHNSVHIGIDVLWGRVGYNFLYGLGGRQVFREAGWATSRGRRAEAIKRPELSRAVLSGLQKIHSEIGPISSVVVHRDGRWLLSESLGLADAISRATKLGYLAQGFTYTVVELKKHHAPIRLFTVPGDTRSELRNPLPGTYLQLDDRRAIMTTTGRPGSWEGSWGRTAGTLLVQIAEAGGTPDIKAVSQDVYDLTHLNWASPDIEISLPVTIRWADSALRETLRTPEDIEEDGDPVGQEDAGSETEVVDGE